MTPLRNKSEETNSGNKPNLTNQILPIECWQSKLRNQILTTEKEFLSKTYWDINSQNSTTALRVFTPELCQSETRNRSTERKKAGLWMIATSERCKTIPTPIKSTRTRRSLEEISNALSWNANALSLSPRFAEGPCQQTRANRLDSLLVTLRSL